MRHDLKNLVTCLLLSCVCLSAHAQSDWLTVSAGDPGLADADAVQVDVDPITTVGAFRYIDIRVNRSTQRTSWDGVAYRSYTATIAVDCAAKTGQYVSLDFYMLPLWKGTSHKKSTYPANEVRPMRFLDISPNPTERIIKAACAIPVR